jgi:hypothetical protein
MEVVRKFTELEPTDIKAEGTQAAVVEKIITFQRTGVGVRSRHNRLMIWSNGVHRGQYLNF